MPRSFTALAARSLAALGLLVLIVTLTPVVSWWARAFAGPWHDPSGDILIVLGGSTLEDGIMGEGSYWRSVYAVRAYREGSFRRIILSGGGGIAESMKDFLECQGVPRQAVQIEGRSESTRENAVYTSKLLGGVSGKKVLLTSDYHMLRASRAFKKAGVDVLPRPFPDVIKRGEYPAMRWGGFVDLARETGALGYYLARGWI